MDFVLNLLKGLAILATGVLFLLEGLSFGCVEFSGAVDLYKDDPRLFILQYARGYGFLSFTYFVVTMIISMICGYFDVFAVIVGIFSLGGSIAIIACISQEYKEWSFGLFGSGIPLLIKMTHTAYYTINILLKGETNTDSGLYAFALSSLIFESLLLLGWSLWPFLSLRSEEQVCNYNNF